MKSNVIHVRELIQSVFLIEHLVDQVARECHAQRDLPDSLKRCVEHWEDFAHELHDKVGHTLSQKVLIEQIDALEALGDEAMRACRDAGAGAVNADVLTAIQRAHRNISELKHQLH